MTAVFSALPIVGWWPEVNVFAPAAKASLLLDAPTVAIMPTLTAAIGWPQLIIGIVLDAPTVAIMPTLTATIG